MSIYWISTCTHTTNLRLLFLIKTFVAFFIAALTDKPHRFDERTFKIEVFNDVFNVSIPLSLILALTSSRFRTIRYALHSFPKIVLFSAILDVSLAPRRRRFPPALCYSPFLTSLSFAHHTNLYLVQTILYLIA